MIITDWHYWRKLMPILWHWIVFGCFIFFIITYLVQSSFEGIFFLIKKIISQLMHFQQNYWIDIGCGRLGKLIRCK